MTVLHFPRHLAVGLLAMLAFLRVETAGAGDIADRAAEAEALLAADNAASALAAFDKAAAAFWIASPLQFREALFAESVAGFGNYQPRANQAFKAGETLLLYLEPIGYGFLPAPDGFRVSLAVDVEIRTPGGLVLGKAEDFAKLEWKARSRTREIHATVSFPLPSLKPGEYLLYLRFRDQGSPKMAELTLPFTIAG